MCCYRYIKVHLTTSTSKCTFSNFYCSHFLSTSSYRTNENTDDSNSSQKPTERQRSDLERLKKLLFQGKSQEEVQRGKSNKRDQKQQQNLSKTKGKEPERKVSSSVNVNKFKNILCALKPGPSSSSSENIALSKMPSAPRDEDEIIDREEKKSSNVHSMDTKQSSSVDVNKFKDALSVLEQDHSSPPKEDVVLVRRRNQRSFESLSALEGLYNVKQRQIRDEDHKKMMPRTSLRTGPRFHWFDDVKTKWDHEKSISEPTLFQEMAEKEVKDLGMSATSQSGFQHLIENIHRQWAFPIDNETCKTDEENVGFDEHVFLEHLLDDFPKSGNIRQFMELVITGLQQNPHLNVQEKKEHILWFKEYFESIPDEHVQI